MPGYTNWDIGACCCGSGFTCSGCGTALATTLTCSYTSDGHSFPASGSFTLTKGTGVLTWTGSVLNNFGTDTMVVQLACDNTGRIMKLTISNGSGTSSCTSYAASPTTAGVTFSCSPFSFAVDLTNPSSPCNSFGQPAPTGAGVHSVTVTP